MDQVKRTKNMDPNDEGAGSNVVVVDSIDKITPDLFSKLLNDRYHSKGYTTIPKISKLTLESVEQGVLSQVKIVNVEFEHLNNDETTTTTSTTAPHDHRNDEIIPRRWILKICRKELNLNWMFRSEKVFYEQLVPKLTIDNNDADDDDDDDDDNNNEKAFPFSIAKSLGASDSHLILEYINDCVCYDLVGGCPTDKIEFMVRSLACWHAKCWQHPALIEYSSNFMNPPGMGQRLSPLQKEYLFSTKWKETLNRMKLQKNDNEDNDNAKKNKVKEDVEDEEELYEFSYQLCEQLSSLRLRDVHDIVHKERWTCIHGDYHVANWLFPKTTNDDDDGTENDTNETDDGERDNKKKKNIQKPVLVDWGTCGYGNPMIDVVFFFIVSTNTDVVCNIHEWLQLYYTTLMTCNPNIAESLSLSSSLQKNVQQTIFMEWFQWTLLYQWMILVTYDEMCNNIALSEVDVKKRRSTLRHFKNVNHRALYAMEVIGNWDTIINTIPKITEKEIEEAETFTKQNVLTI